MRVLCVYSTSDFATVDKPLRDPTFIPFGLAMIGTVLKAAGHEVKTLVLTPRTPVRQKVVWVIDSFGPQLFCLSSVSTEMAVVREVAEIAKESVASGHVIVGGVHAILNPEEVIGIPAIDSVCVGEGEIAIVELARQLEEGNTLRPIQNLWIKERRGQILKLPLGDFIKDLDRLSYVDWEMWYPWVASLGNIHSVVVGRGCPNKCAYCSNHRLARAGRGRYVRFRTPSNVVVEVARIASENLAKKGIFLEAETLGANFQYTLALCEALDALNRWRKEPIRFGCNLALNSRVLGSQEELLSAMRRANFKVVKIGLESGSKRIRQEVLRRPKYSNEQLIDFCHRVKSYGIEIGLYVLMGVPQETLEDYNQTIRCIRQCQPDYVNRYIFYPYKGTDIYTRALSQGLFNEDACQGRGGVERRRPVLDQSGFTGDQVMREYVLFWFRTFYGRWPLTRILAHTVRDAFETVPFLHNTLRRVVPDSELIRRLKDRLTKRLGR